MARRLASPWVALVAGLSLVPAACSGHRTVEQRMGDHLQAARDAVHETVKEPARAERLIECLDRVGELLREQREAQVALTARLQDRNADPDTTTAELQAEFDAFLEERHARRAQLLDLHDTMRETTQPEEWAAIVDAEVEALGLGAGMGGS